MCRSAMEHRREIDGLRAVAVVPVVGFHAGFNLFGGGYVGVDVFFVISGYLITSILVNDLEDGQFSITKFYERRARRILPALFVVTLCCSPFAMMWMLPSQLKDFFQSLVAVTLFVSNILFWNESGYFSAAADLKPLLHTWSLAVEEQFYLIFPLILLTFWRLGRRRLFEVTAVGALCSFALAELAIRTGGMSEAAVFYLAPTRFWEILVGALCAFLLAGRRQKENNWFSAAGLALIAYSTFCYESTTPFPGVYALAPVAGAALVILFGGSGTWAGQLLSAPIFVGVGLISYSLYLWHQPLFALARIRSMHEPGAELMALLTLLSLGLAYLTWKYVEQPFRRRGTPLLPTRRAIFGASAAGSVTLAAFGVIGHGLEGRLGPAASVPEFILAALEEKNDRTHCLRRVHDFDLQTALRECSLETSGEASVVLLGDSHADQYAHALREGARSIGYDFHQLTVNSCLPFSGLVALDRSCDQYASDVTAALSAIRPSLVIISARWTSYLTGHGYDNGEGGVEGDIILTFEAGNLSPGTLEYQDELGRSFLSGIEEYLNSGVTVLLMYPMPEAGWHVPEVYSKFFRFGDHDNYDIVISTSHESFLKRNDRAIRMLDNLRHDRILRYRPDQVLCDSIVPDRCINAVADRILYYDDDHLSITGNELLMPSLLEMVGAGLSVRFGQDPPSRPPW
jgi:peptidoglycan/LPS O-acetylase OafA/YrhL